MKKLRDIIEIDEKLCDGCGQCILECAEGALEIVDGKARLVGEIFCDGLGACLSGCPTGALKIVRREADGYDEEAVEKRLDHMQQQKAQPLASPSCGGERPMELKPASGREGSQTTYASGLGHWPVKLQLLPTSAPFLKDADLVLLADCAAAAMPDLHQNFLPGKAIALACPKLDDFQAHLNKLAAVLEQSPPRSLTVLRMEVPCCKGLEVMALEAARKSGLKLDIQSLTLGRGGRILSSEKVNPAQAGKITLF